MKQILAAAAVLVMLAQSNELKAEEDAVSQTQSDPYRALVNALNFRADDSESNEALVKRLVIDGLKQDPEISEMEEWCPGSLQAMWADAGHIFLRDAAISEQQYNDGSYAIFASSLTKEEAIEATLFYESELGRRVVSAANKNVSVDYAIRDVMSSDDGSISRDSVEKDKRNQSRTTLRSLSAADRFELRLIIESASWSEKMDKLNPQTNRSAACD